MPWAPGARSCRRRTPMPPSCSPRAAGCSCRRAHPKRGPRRSTTCSAMTSAGPSLVAARTRSRGTWSGPMSPSNIARCLPASQVDAPAPSALPRLQRLVPEAGAHSSLTSAPLPRPVRRHLEALSDEVGILQHAVGRAGDPSHGYCVDDVARALELDVMQSSSLGWNAVQGRARRNLRFLEEAYLPTERRFRNFRGVDGTWRVERASDDCQGRAILALGTVVGSCADRKVVAGARELLLDALPGTRELRSPRAVASCLLGVDAAYGAGETGLREELESRANRLAVA